MAFSGGTYTLPGAALNTGDTVSATENNTFRNDVATAFNLTWLRNGTAAATADIPMGGYSFTNCAAVGSNGSLLLKVNNGTTAATFDTSGNLGLGVTPSAWSLGKVIEVGHAGNAIFDVTSSQLTITQNAYYNGGYKYGASTTASRYDQGAGAHAWYTAASGTAGNAITFTQAMTLDASGNLLVGGTTNSSGLKILATDGTVQAGFLPYATNSVAYTGTWTNHSFAFVTNGSERARIDSSGNLLVGTTSSAKGSSGSIFSAGSAQENIRLNGTSPQTFVTFNLAGTTVGSISATGSTTTYATSSDYRLKDNIAPMVGALEKVVALKPVTYKWKSDGSQGQGFIAHELQEVVPDAVVGEKDATSIEQYEITPAVPATFDDEGNVQTPSIEAVMGEREVPVYQGIDTSFLVATLTAAIQEQQAIITQLQADIEVLKGKA